MHFPLLLRYGYKKRMKKKEQYFLDVQSSRQKPETTQDSQALQNSDGKQYCQYWMLRLVAINYIARKQRLLVEALYAHVR